MKPKKFIIIIIFTFLTHLLFAQDVKFEAATDRNTVAMGDRFQVVFTLNAEGRGFKPPVFEYFQVLSGPSTSNSMSMEIINGTMKQSVKQSFTYLLAPKQEGKFSIASASITVNGKNIASNSIGIDVVKGNTQSKQAISQNVQSQPDADGSDDELFLAARVDKTKVYHGEQLIVTYTLYFRVDIIGNEVNKLPSLTGFWSEDVQMPQRANIYTANINGVSYRAADIKKAILFPQRSGELEIDPMEFKCVVRKKVKNTRQGFFGDFFGNYEDKQHIVKNKPVKIRVLPLPEGKPEGFSGAVGKFGLDASIDRNELTVNDAANIKIQISGTGNLRLIEPFKLKFPPDIESYDPKVSDKIIVNESGVSGKKTFEYLLIPRHAGELTINSGYFTYFNPDLKKYITLTSPEYKLKAEKGTGTEGMVTVIPSVSKEDVRYIGSDILFIKSPPFKMKKSGDSFFLSGNFYLLYGSPLLFLLLFLMIRRNVFKEHGNIILMRRKRANRMANKRLKKAKKYLKEKKDRQFYEEILRAIWGYAGDKLSIPVADISKESVIDLLKQRSVTEQTTGKLIKLLDHCEFASYAPPVETNGTEDICKEAVNVISDIEDELFSISEKTCHFSKLAQIFTRWR